MCTPRRTRRGRPICCKHPQVYIARWTHTPTHHTCRSTQLPPRTQSPPPSVSTCDSLSCCSGRRDPALSLTIRKTGSLRLGFPPLTQHRPPRKPSLYPPGPLRTLRGGISEESCPPPAPRLAMKGHGLHVPLFRGLWLSSAPQLMTGLPCWGLL